MPGCSTGEETYSHAITLLEFLGEERAEVPIQIFGTDLSDTAIQRARSGMYKETIEADVSAVRLRRFFHRVDSGYQISKTIRDLCIFSTQNVFSDPPFSRIDLVRCRNVMIYLSHSLQRRVIPIFHYALNPGGFLMIGNTEGLLGSGSELFEMADKKQKIYRKRSVPTPLSVGFSVYPSEPHGEGTAPVPASKPMEPQRLPGDLQREADRLLNEYVRITVADNGKGIPRSAMPHLFEPLFTTKGAVSTGLGLWVSRQIVEKYGGWIRLRSCTTQPRRGTTFSIFLPSAGSRSPQPEQVDGVPRRIPV